MDNKERTSTRKVKIYLSKLPYELLVQIHEDIEKNKQKEEDQKKRISS